MAEVQTNREAEPGNVCDEFCRIEFADVFQENLVHSHALGCKAFGQKVQGAYVFYGVHHIGAGRKERSPAHQPADNV